MTPAEARKRGAPPKTHCLKGHEFTQANTYLYEGHKRCRKCQYLRNLDTKARRRSEA